MASKEDHRLKRCGQKDERHWAKPRTSSPLHEKAEESPVPPTGDKNTKNKEISLLKQPIQVKKKVNLSLL